MMLGPQGNGPEANVSSVIGQVPGESPKPTRDRISSPQFQLADDDLRQKLRTNLINIVSKPVGELVEESKFDVEHRKKP
jgi:hypothetical protein